MPLGNAIRALTVLLILCGAALALFAYHAGRGVPVPPPPAATTQALGQFTVLDPPLPAPTLAFAARSGEEKHLADFRGKLVLVNLWATWCAPCLEEMPALDRVQAEVGDALTILAISEDRRGAAAVDPFLAKAGIEHLAIYLDPKGAATAAFVAEGLPMSFLIGRDGAILGKEEGAAKWDGAAMLAILRRYIDDAR